jgi:non-homologous end joining protein Ku
MTKPKKLAQPRSVWPGIWIGVGIVACAIAVLAPFYASVTSHECKAMNVDRQTMRRLISELVVTQDFTKAQRDEISRLRGLIPDRSC